MYMFLIIFFSSEQHVTTGVNTPKFVSHHIKCNSMSTTLPVFKSLGAINAGKQNMLLSFIVIS